MSGDTTTKDDDRIVRWLRAGNDGLDGQGIETVPALLARAGRALDRACSSEIMGEVVFQTGDGVWRVGTVEFVVGEANPDYVADLQAEDAAEPEAEEEAGTDDESDRKDH